MWKIAVSLVTALVVPCSALAASELFAERAKVIASGSRIQIFGLPSIDSQGTVKYFDTTIDLKHGDNGRPKKQASVSVVSTPNVDPMGFVPGEYADENVNCRLEKSPFGGQTEVILNCVNEGRGSTAEVVLYTGPIASNPSAAVLQSRQADQIPGTEQYAWGLTTANSDSGYFGGCLTDVFITTARQVGDVLVLIRWSSNTPVTQSCTLNLTRVTP